MFPATKRAHIKIYWVSDIFKKIDNFHL
jgi:hypothetical protein